MGFTGLARWVNADVHGYNSLQQNIEVNHNGRKVGKWRMGIKSYRSSIYVDPTNPGAPSTLPEHTMLAVTMGENAFVLIDSPAAPIRGESSSDVKSGHFRSTYQTLRPPGALEAMLSQLKAPWVPVRSGTSSQPQSQSRGQAATNALLTAAELVIEGWVFSIGQDWLVRVGMVRSKDLLRGLVIEVEYLPLPLLYSPEVGGPVGESELVSQFLASLLPIHRADTSLVAVALPDAQWKEVLITTEEWKREVQEAEAKAKMEAEGKPESESKMDTDDATDDEDDVYAYGLDVGKPSSRHDWIGVDRDRRSAYLVLGALRTENIL